MPTETKYDTENRFVWNQIDSIFDPLGALDLRVTFYDAGLIKEEDFENGVLISKTSFDGDDVNKLGTSY